MKLLSDSIITEANFHVNSIELDGSYSKSNQKHLGNTNIGTCFLLSNFFWWIHPELASLVTHILWKAFLLNSKIICFNCYLRKVFSVFEIISEISIAIHLVFLSIQFISNYPLDGKLLSNFQDSTFFHQATIKNTGKEKWGFSFAVNIK